MSKVVVFYGFYLTSVLRLTRLWTDRTLQGKGWIRCYGRSKLKMYFYRLDDFELNLFHHLCKAEGGLMHITGEPDGMPVKIGVAITGKIIRRNGTT